MPEVNPVMSRVVPDGTAMLLRTIVAQDFLEALADAALLNVQEARFSKAFPSSGAGVGIGAGAAVTRATAPASRLVQSLMPTMITTKVDSKRDRGNRVGKKRR